MFFFKEHLDEQENPLRLQVFIEGFLDKFFENSQGIDSGVTFTGTAERIFEESSETSPKKDMTDFLK